MIVSQYWVENIGSLLDAPPYSVPISLEVQRSHLRGGYSPFQPIPIRGGVQLITDKRHHRAQHVLLWP